MQLHIRFFIPLLFLFFSAPIIAQDTTHVMVIGEKGDAYNSYSSKCPEMLLTAAGGSMEKAYDKWLGIMTDIQVYADSVGVNLRGVKIWVNAYWNKDGTLRAIAYHPKPNSKNMEMGRLTTLLREFSKTHRLDLEHTTCYSHYGSASFPVVLMGGKRN